MQGPSEDSGIQVSASSTPQLPRPPCPSADVGISTGSGESSVDPGVIPDPDILDVFTLTPIAALKMLCGLIETLVRITGDMPLTPPISQPTTPNLRELGEEKGNAASHAREGGPRNASPGSGDVDGVLAKAKTPIGSPEAHPTEPLRFIGADADPLIMQHGAIARKFYSKKTPPISLEKYLLRLHEYCPMSTAVYLATSLYIHRLAVVKRIIPVTARNVHRLMLAGLRVAMKALEDQSYPHRRFAKVGGVSEPELGRLEVSFCFITNFELKVDKEMLLKHAKAIRDGTLLYKLPTGFQPQIPPLKDRGNLIVGQSKPLVMITQEAPAAA